tara:strand:+ start:271 stop:4791 length:4521 start_codon:yes stop_codon:yes gene_type:complete
MKSLYVRGSRGNLYKITKDGDNYTCECKSFYYNRHICKHIEKLKKEKSNKMSKTSSKEKETSNDAKIKLAKDSIKKLRNKILVGSTTNQNKLINFKHSDRGRGYTRIVDELPDSVFENLVAGKTFIFKPLPEPDFEPKDEKSREFKMEFQRAQKEDEAYLKKIEKMGDDYDGVSKESLELDRELKDRIRAKLKMKKRSTPDVIGLTEYAKKCGINPSFVLPKLKQEKLEKHKDNFLQTILLPEQLDRRLSFIKRTANKAINEKGIDTLFLAIGFVEWYEKKTSDVKLLSPLLLLSVELNEIKKSKGSEFHLNTSNGEIQINVALKAKFEKDFGIVLDEVEEEDTPEKYFEKFEASIKNRKKWSLKRFMTLGHFQFQRMAMYHDLDPNNWVDLGSQQSLQDIFSGSEASDGAEAEEYDVDEKEISSKVPLLLNQADASQFSAIVDVMNNKNLALQGPPGTGKSQTITNMIGAALAENKKVLFVADKTAARNVVYKKLQDAGLGDFCLHITSTGMNKANFFEDIKQRINLKTNKVPKKDLDFDISKEKKIKDELIEYKKLITSEVGVSEKNIYELYGLRAKYKKFEKKIFDEIFEDDKNKFFESTKVEEITPTRVKVIAENLEKIEEQSSKFKSKYKNLKNHPWYGFIGENLNPYEKKELIKNLSKADSNIIKLNSEISTLQKNQNIKEFKNLSTIDEIRKFLDFISELDKDNQFLIVFKNISSLKDLEKLNTFATKIKDIKPDLEVENKINSIFKFKSSHFRGLEKIKKTINNSNILSFASSEFRNAKKEYLNMVKSNVYRKNTAIKDLDLLSSYKKIYRDLQTKKKNIENDSAVSKLLKKDFNGIQTNLKLIEYIFEYFSSLSQNFEKNTIDLLLKKKDLLKTIKTSTNNISKAFNEIVNFYEEIEENIEDDKFFGEKFYDCSLEIISNKIKKLDPKTLDDWTEFVNIRKNNSSCENVLLDSFDKNQLKYENLKEIFYALYYNYLLKYFYKEYPNLANYSGEKLDSLRVDYEEIDRAIAIKKKENLKAKLRNRRITQGISRGPTKKLTELGLIERIIGQKKPRISLRKFIKQSSEALSELKPCFMMSPLTLAELVRPQEDLFDLLIIDEASQMRMQDAIGGLARSSQCVIVGDPQQLAPSDFFSVAEQEDTEEDLVEESILDLALTRFKPMRMLRWHYRSRNEKLINFSNHHFYENQLIIPPSPSINKAIHHNYAKALYKGKINNQEKDELVNGLLDFMKKNIRKNDNDKKSKSCLVVTMNIFQQELIEEELRLRETKEGFISDYIKSWDNTLEKFEVKNLESVQGDERDAIFISTLFGPNEHGKVLQTFGPINNPDRGHRRLNVLFTRAKKEIHFYTSMHPNDVQLKEGTAQGRMILKNYIEYAKTGKLEIGDISEGKEPMSEFEIFVMNGLKNMGYEVVPQVGVSGFYIDIGIKHKSFPDGFIAGIECDGRTYHSSKSQRDSDILRQNILEDLGWNIYRIWSTDWWLDPKKELRKVDRYLKKLI